MKWVRIKKLAELSGLTEHAIRAYIKKGLWLEGKIWRKATNGCLWFNTTEVEAWVEGRAS